MVAEGSLAGEEGSDRDLEGGEPISNPGFEDVPVELLNPGRAQPLESELVKTLVDDAAADRLVNVDTLLAVAARDHARGDGAEIVHGKKGHSLHLVDTLGGWDLIVFEVRKGRRGIPGNIRAIRGGDRLGIETVAVGGKYLIEFFLEAAHGRLHESLAPDEKLAAGN